MSVRAQLVITDDDLPADLRSLVASWAELAEDGLWLFSTDEWEWFEAESAAYPGELRRRLWEPGDQLPDDELEALD